MANQTHGTRAKREKADWVNPSHTVLNAARDAARRGRHLEVSWTVGNGLKVIAVENIKARRPRTPA